MRNRMILSTIAVVVSIGNFTPPARAQTQNPADAAVATRMQTLKTGGPKASVTILPVRVLGRTSRNVADALGLVLERSGMDNLQAVDQAFDLPAGTPWDQAPARLGGFLKTSPPGTDYVLYAEFLGDPKTGPTEVRWLIADASGALVVTDRQLPTDPDFRRTAARDPDPLGCSTLVAERVFSTLDWKKGAGQTPGRFARMWAEKSGVASDEERTAMESRAEKLKRTLKTCSIGVYPTRVGTTPDVPSAGRLSRELGDRLGCRASVPTSAPRFEIEPTSNQQKRLWDLARGLREHLRADPLQTDYAMLAEYLIDPAGAVRSVNFVVCDKAGDWVIVDFQNDQHADFQRMTPKSVEDCERLTCERLAGYLR